MKDKLRELAERWKQPPWNDDDFACGSSAGSYACAAELLAIIDAEGDAGAVFGCLSRAVV